MRTILIVAGLKLDAAWPQFDPETGTQLRAWSQDLLHQIVAASYDQSFDALIFLGGLFDRSTTGPSTVSETREMLTAIDSDVVVIPGEADWLGHGSPYDYVSWDGVEIVRSDSLEPIELLPECAACAVGGPGRTLGGRLRDTGDAAVILVPGLDADEAVGVGSPIITNGSELTLEPGRIVVPPIAEPSGESLGVLVTVTDDGVRGRPFPFAPCPLEIAELDISSFTSTEELNAALEHWDGSQLVHIRLVGAVGQRVLVPGFSGWRPPAGITLDLAGLEYPMPTLPDDAQSADQQFVRAVSTLDIAPNERHQTAALGLLAMAEEA